jgi:hypothetical protein
MIIATAIVLSLLAAAALGPDLAELHRIKHPESPPSQPTTSAHPGTPTAHR